MRRLRLLAAALVLLAAAAPSASAQTDPAVTSPPPSAPTPRVETPKKGALYEHGPTGRFLLAGTWLFRLDPTEVGLKQGFQKQSSTARMGDDDRAQRLERHRRIRGVHERDRRLVPQGLPAAVEVQAVQLRRPVRVGQLPITRLAERQADRHQPGARTCRSSCVCPPGSSSARAPTAWSSASTTAATRPTSRPPGCRSPARRPAAGGTTAASCARSTCARSTASTSRPCRFGRSCPARPAPPTCNTRSWSATTAPSR